MSEIISKDGVIVKRSRNLRGVLDYARQHPVIKAEIDYVETSGGYLVKFYYWDNAASQSNWADADVARCWVYDRLSWGKPVKADKTVNKGILTKEILYWLTDDQEVKRQAYWNHRNK